MAHLKYTYLIVCTVLSVLPGRIGNLFETKRLFMLKARGYSKAKVMFDQALDDLGPDSVVIDLGANVGVFTEALAKVAGHVHAFEPDPWAFGQLENRVRHLDNVTLYRKAVGAGSGTAQLRRVADFETNPGPGSQGSTLKASDDMFYEMQADGIDVEVVDFVAFLRDLDTDIDLIKIDIEGSEIELLNSFLASDVLHRVARIFCETHEAQMPMLRKPTRDLKRRIQTITRPYINLDWI